VPQATHVINFKMGVVWSPWANLSIATYRWLSGNFSLFFVFKWWYLFCYVCIKFILFIKCYVLWLLVETVVVLLAAPTHSRSHCTGWVPGYRSRDPGFDSRRYHIFWKQWIWNGAHSASWI
jgi:hypothetical protein